MLDVIHAVGPIGEDKEELTLAYENCLRLVLEHNIKTIVFCGISSGIYGYPVPKAASVALSTVRNWLERDDNWKKVDKIVFSTFLKNEKIVYDTLTPVFFP
jgi:O-acetyl-ADP-ribose deacetylase (regulator of RNase III)